MVIQEKVMAKSNRLEMARALAVRSQLSLAIAIKSGSNSGKIALLRELALIAKNDLTMLVAAARKKEKS